MSFEVEEIEKKRGGGIITKAPSCHEC